MPMLAHARAPAARVRRIGTEPKRVLIVEDDADSLETLLLLCRAARHTCLSASRRAEALAMLVGRPPDVVLLDLMLPDGNGIEVLRVIRSHGFGPRVGVLTGVEDSPLLDEVKQLEPDALFRKPLDFAALREWLASA